MSSLQRPSSPERFWSEALGQNVLYKLNIDNYTRLQQDRQARNKDPNTGLPNVLPDEEDETSNLPPIAPPEDTPEIRERIRRELEWMEERKREYDEFSLLDSGWEQNERRSWGAAILDNPEVLMMNAITRCDTLQATRLHFTRVMCGYDDEEDDIDAPSYPSAADDKRDRKRRSKKRRHVAQVSASIENDTLEARGVGRTLSATVTDDDDTEMGDMNVGVGGSGGHAEGSANAGGGFNLGDLTEEELQAIYAYEDGWSSDS